VTEFLAIQVALMTVLPSKTPRLGHHLSSHREFLISEFGFPGDTWNPRSVISLTSWAGATWHGVPGIASGRLGKRITPLAL